MYTANCVGKNWSCRISVFRNSNGGPYLDPCFITPMSRYTVLTEGFYIHVHVPTHFRFFLIRLIFLLYHICLLWGGTRYYDVSDPDLVSCLLHYSFNCGMYLFLFCQKTTN